MPVSVIGAGLAGCEAAWQLANRGIEVDLYEQKPYNFSPAHTYKGFAELVCSNSLKAMRKGSAAGMLKEEMRLFGSLVMQCADETAVSAGGALAVDRELFSDAVTAKISAHKNIKIITREVTEVPDSNVIIATGPLTSANFSAAIKNLLGSEYLSFYDAAAPIVEFDSIDKEQVFFAARYDRGEADYINCPMNKEEYENFHTALVGAETAKLHGVDKAEVYEGCMPIEVLAKRGADSIRFGPLKPVGLKDPRTGHRPWAVVQLRKENAEGSLYNLVGFQTNLRFPEQKRVFSMLPGLKNAEFARYGVMHRNTFINSPKLLTPSLCLKNRSNIYFAGQITGVEGYIESAACGILAGYNLASRLAGRAELTPPREAMLGALIAYITDETVENFQPMGSNMGILPPLPEHIRDKQERYTALAERGIEALRAAVIPL